MGQDGPIGGVLRLARGVAEVRDGRTRVVLANLGNKAVRITAGQLLGFGVGIDEGEYTLCECRPLEDPPVSEEIAKLARVYGVLSNLSAGMDNPFYVPGVPREEGKCELDALERGRDTDVSRPEEPSFTVKPPDDPDVQEVWVRLPSEVQDILADMPIVSGPQDVPEHLRVVQLGEALTPLQRRVAWTLVKAYADVFNNSPTVPSRTQKYRANIDTGTAQPINSAPYRVSPSEREIIDKAVDEMLAAGVIRPSRSPWSSPVVLVPKKDGTIRFCVDYRKLNKLTRVEVYPLPRVDETLRAFQGAVCFSVMDMQSGYWQIPLHEDAIHKTAFATHRGLHEYVVLPFGPVNAPGYFQRMMDEVMGGLKWSSVLVYIDDLIVFSKSVEQHMLDLSVVFQRLREAGLTLKPKKCELFAKSVKYLGHVVSAKGMAPDPDKVRAIRDMPVPTDKTEVLSFLGMAGYYRRFVPKFADVVMPLQRLARHDEPFVWGSAQEAAYNTVKRLLCAEPVVLSHPDFRVPFVLMTDASNVGIGAVLSQIDPDTSAERVVEYASRSLTRAEAVWSPTEKEALAVKWACEVMRPYVFGSRFKVITDHRALQWLFHNHTVNQRLQRWALQLMEYNFEIVHRPGGANANADGPSRLPLPEGKGIREDVGDAPESRVLALAIPARGAEEEDQRVDLRLGSESAPERRRLRLPAEVGDRAARLARAILPSDEEMVHALKEDARFGPIYNFLLSGVPPEGEDQGYAARIEPYYCVEDGLLLVFSGQKRALREGPEAVTTRVVIPTSLTRQVVAHHHVQPEAGHLSAKGTYARFRHLFWWPCMWKDTVRLVSECPDCQVGDRRSGPSAGPLCPIEVSQPWDLVGIDLVGPFRLTPRFNKYILTMIDYYSRWVIFVPLREAKAADIVTAVMENLVHKFGPPAALISDRGAQFTGGLFQRLMSRLSVKYSATSAYHPQSNGRVERVHRVLNAMLARQVNVHHTDWDEYVSASAFAVNTSWSRSTGHSPYELLFGRRPRTPAEIIHGHRVEVVTDKREYGLRLPAILRETHRKVARVHDMYVKRMSEYYNKNRKAIAFEPGSLIKLYQPAVQPHIPKRMQLRWTGPHTVVRAVPPYRPGGHTLNYVVEIDGEHIVCNVGRMRPYIPSEEDDRGEQPPPPSISDAEWQDILRDVVGDEEVAQEPVGMRFGDEASMGDVGGSQVQLGERRPDPIDMDVDMGGMDVDVQSNAGSDFTEVKSKSRAWDNVLGDVPGAVPRNAILVGQQILAWSEGDDGVRRWWAGVVHDRPSARKRSVEMQPYNSRDRKKCIADAVFALVWWDPRAWKEDWRMIRKPHFQPLTMEIPEGNVVLVNLRWRKGRRLPADALAILGHHEAAEKVAAEEAEEADEERQQPDLKKQRPAPDGEE